MDRFASIALFFLFFSLSALEIKMQETPPDLIISKLQNKSRLFYLFTFLAITNLLKIMYIIEQAQGLSSNCLYIYSNLSPALFARYAIEYKKDNLLRFLLTWLHVNPNFRDIHANTLLGYAIACKNENAIKMLLSCGASIKTASSPIYGSPTPQCDYLLGFLNIVSLWSCGLKFKHTWMMEKPEQEELVNYYQHGVTTFVVKGYPGEYKAILYLASLDIAPDYFRDWAHGRAGHNSNQAFLLLYYIETGDPKVKNLIKMIEVPTEIKKWKDEVQVVTLPLNLRKYYLNEEDTRKEFSSVLIENHDYHIENNVCIINKAVIYTLLYK